MAIYCAMCILIGIGATVSYGIISSHLRQIDVEHICNTLSVSVPH